MTPPTTLAEFVRALLESEETYRLVFARERDPMWLTDCATGRFLEVNDAWVEQYGYSREEALSGMGPADVIVEEGEPSAGEAMDVHGTRRIDLRWHRRKDGTVFPVEMTWGSLHLGGRDVVYAVVRDIGERVEAEKALRRSERTFRTLMEGLPLAVVVHRAGRIVYANPACRDLLGYESVQELIDMPVLDIVHPDDREAVRDRIARTVYAGQPAPLLEERFVRRDGTIVIVEVSAIPTVFDGEPAALALGKDVTARKAMEAQLVTADRLASIGRLAASVGHEINNPLLYVLGGIELLRRQLADLRSDPSPEGFDRAAERLAAIEQGARRVRDIVRDLKVLARSDDDAGGPADLHRTLDLCVDMAGHELRHRARLAKDYGPDARVRGTEARLGQVFLNILVNAAQAIPEGQVQDNEVRIRTRTRGRRVVVEISDTGVGLPPETDVSRIFEPFFTTKDGSGTGLGLSICHHIVSSLGGTIEAERRAPRGTRFRVTLPLADEDEVSPEPSHTPEPTVAATRGRVLIVDDEPLITRVLCHWLENYDVTVAHSGREALALLSGDSGYDVILCDLMMGDLTGMDVYEHVATERPGLERRIVFMSGGAYTRRAREFLATVPNPHLEKPFDVRDAARAVREVLLRTP